MYVGSHNHSWTNGLATNAFAKAIAIQKGHLAVIDPSKISTGLAAKHTYAAAR